MSTSQSDLERLLEEEPFVRSLTESLVSDEVDDVVQQAWLHALQKRPPSIAQPRNWLARVVRNLVTDTLRRRENRDLRQRLAAVEERLPSSVELLEAEERRRALIMAVDSLPATQRAVVLLRYYEGLPPRRIASELGLPTKTVANRLHAALNTLRERLDKRHGGDRRAWLLPLVPFAAGPRPLPWAEVTGIIAMTTKSKLVASATAVMLVVLACIAWPKGEPLNLPQSPGTNQPLNSVGVALDRETSAQPREEPHREQIAATNPTTPTTGSLRITVRYHDEPAVVADKALNITRAGSDFRLGLRRAITDVDGCVEFDDLQPGKYIIIVPTHFAHASAVVEAGTIKDCRLVIEEGFHLTGIVVDPTGVPIAGAIIEGTAPALSRSDVQPIAFTAADGTFEIRHCSVYWVVAARAAGYAASAMKFVTGKRGSTQHVRLQMRLPGGIVEGRVIDDDGEPVAEALVRVGEGRTDAIRTTDQGAPPVPAQVLTSADGTFRAIGVPEGDQPIQVRALDKAPWSGVVTTTAGTTAFVHVVLSVGLTCKGTVEGENGAPLAQADVRAGNSGDFVQYWARSAADGSFEITGLPTAGIELRCIKSPLGKAAITVSGAPGETVNCTLRLSNGLALRGVVLDEDDEPVESAMITCGSESSNFSRPVTSKADGSFVVSHCPENELLTLRVHKPGHVVARRNSINPRAGKLEIRLPRDTTPKARISGSVVGPHGGPVEELEVVAIRYRPRQTYLRAKLETDGRFAVDVSSGRWVLSIKAPGYPDINQIKELSPGAQWDVGTVALARGGRLVMDERGTSGAYYLVYDEKSKFICGLHSPEPPLRSELLAPGEYTLLIRRNGSAAQSIPFVIRADEETKKQLKLEPGVRQQIEFLPAEGKKAPSIVRFRIWQGDQMLLHERASGGELVRDIWLSPGDYTLKTYERTPGESVMFTVGASEGTRLRVPLR